MTDKSWLNSLQVGSKVAVRNYTIGSSFEYTINKIIKITPTKQIQVEGITKRFRDGIIPSDRYNNGKDLCPLTPEIEEKVLRRDTIAMMKNVKEDKISTEKLRRIREILEEGEN